MVSAVHNFSVVNRQLMSRLLALKKKIALEISLSDSLFI
jgi:hypothetical protein